MYCVVDSSFIASLYLPDEAKSDEGSAKFAVLAREIAKDGATAPGIWQYEMANLLIMAERRRRITSAVQKQILLALDDLPITLQPYLTHQQRNEVMHLAQKHQLTAYDAAYLELSLRLNLPLATIDGQLVRAVTAEGGAALEPLHAGTHGALGENQ